MKFVDITLRIPVTDDVDETVGPTLAADVREIVIDNLADVGIEEVRIVSIFVGEKQ